MDMSMYMESINLVKSLEGRYKEKDKKMVIETLEHYKQKNKCSYKYAYDKLVDTNPSFSTYMQWRKKAKAEL